MKKLLKKKKDSVLIKKTASTLIEVFRFFIIERKVNDD